jgi:hypothetical protein
MRIYVGLRLRGCCRSGHPHPIHIRLKLGDKPTVFPAKFVDKAVVGSGARPVHFVLPEGAGANRQTVTGSDLRDGPGNRVRWSQGHRMRIPGRSAVTLDLFRAAANRLAGPPTSSFGRFVVRGSVPPSPGRQPAVRPLAVTPPAAAAGRNVSRRHTNPTNVHAPIPKPTWIVDLGSRSCMRSGCVSQADIAHRPGARAASAAQASRSVSARPTALRLPR